MDRHQPVSPLVLDLIVNSARQPRRRRVAFHRIGEHAQPLKPLLPHKLDQVAARDSPADQLQLLDLWVTILSDEPQCDVWGEIYANPALNHLVGATSGSVPLRFGKSRLDVEARKFQDGEVTTAWHVQPDWEDLYLVLVSGCQDEISVSKEVTKIHLSQDLKIFLELTGIICLSFFHR